MEAKLLGNYGIFDAEYSASYFGANPGRYTGRRK